MNHDEMDELPATEKLNESASEPTQQEITND
jgi:hypothetical protein